MSQRGPKSRDSPAPVLPGLDVRRLRRVEAAMISTVIGARLIAWRSARAVYGARPTASDGGSAPSDALSLSALAHSDARGFSAGCASPFPVPGLDTRTLQGIQCGVKGTSSPARYLGSLAPSETKALNRRPECHGVVCSCIVTACHNGRITLKTNRLFSKGDEKERGRARRRLAPNGGS